MTQVKSWRKKMNDLWKNLMSYFQNTDVAPHAKGVVSHGLIPEQSSPSVSNYLPKETNIRFSRNDKPQFPEEYVPYLTEAQDQYRIDPATLASLVAQETGGYGYQPIRGTSGERGITQIIPGYWAGQAGMPEDDYGMRLENDPRFAILEAARILAQYREQFPGYELAAYNAGPNYEPGMGYMEAIQSRLGR